MDTSGAAAKGRNTKRLTDRTVVALRAESGRRVTRPDGDVPGLDAAGRSVRIR